MILPTHLHAIIVHFPVALLIVGFLIEIVAIIFKRKLMFAISFYLLIIGSGATILAYISGYYAGDGIEDGPLKEPMSMHQSAALITLCLACVTSVVYAVKSNFKQSNRAINVFVFLLYASLFTSILRTGYLGGQLVYKHGVGVELELPDFNSDVKSLESL